MEMEIKANPNPGIWTESVASNTGLDHCKRNKISSNSDTEASGSCNFEPVKRPRKVLKKMAGPSHGPELRWEEKHTLSQEEREKQYLAMINANVSPSHIKPLLEEAAKVVNKTPLSGKCYANPFLSVLECEIIAKELSCKHNIHLPYELVKRKLESLYFAFEAYCKEMKLGSSGLSFYWEDGTVSIANQLPEMCDLIASKFCQIKERWEDVISNFGGLKTIYPFVWDKYFKNVSKRRSGSNMQTSSTKRSRGSTSSVNNFSNEYERVLNRLHQLFGKGVCGHLPRQYAEAAKTLFGNDPIECLTFLRFEAYDAKEYFLTKMGGV